MWHQCVYVMMMRMYKYECVGDVNYCVTLVCVLGRWCKVVCIVCLCMLPRKNVRVFHEEAWYSL